MGSLVSTWNLDGFADEQRYYCSSTPIDTNNLPAPKAVLSGGVRTYTDENVIPGQKYYVRIGSVKNGVEKISTEFVVIAAVFLLNMPFSSDIHDHGVFDLQAVAYGTTLPSIVGGALYVPSGSYLKITPTQSVFNVGSSDFEFGVEVAMFSPQPGTFPCIFAVGDGWGVGAVSMQFNASQRMFMAAFMNPTEKDAVAATAQAFDGVTFTKYIVRRVAGVVTTYKDNIAGPTLTDSMPIDFSKNNTLTIGKALWQTSITSSHCKIKNLYLRKL